MKFHEAGLVIFLWQKVGRFQLGHASNAISVNLDMIKTWKWLNTNEFIDIYDKNFKDGAMQDCFIDQILIIMAQADG